MNLLKRLTLRETLIFLLIVLLDLLKDLLLMTFLDLLKALLFLKHLPVSAGSSTITCLVS